MIHSKSTEIINIVEMPKLQSDNEKKYVFKYFSLIDALFFFFVRIETHIYIKGVLKFNIIHAEALK